MPAPQVVAKDAALRPLTDVITKVGNAAAPTGLPSVSSMLDSWQRGFATWPDVVRVAQLSGYCLDRQLPLPTYMTGDVLKSLEKWWSGSVAMAEVWPSIADSILLYRLNLMAVEDFNRITQLSGFATQAKRDWLYTANLAYPAIDSLIDLEARGIFAPEYVTYFGLNRNVPAGLAQIFNGLGYNHNVGIPPDVLAKLPNTKWTDVLWWGHWSQPGFGQVNEMRWRFRDSFARPGTPADPSKIILTDLDWQKYLDISNVPSFWRDRLTAISYKVPQIRKLQNLYDLGIATDGEIVDAFMNQGYQQTNAVRLAETVINSNVLKLHTQNVALIHKQITEAYTLGIITDADFRRSYYGSVVLKLGQIQAFAALPPADQQAAADKDATTIVALSTLDGQISIDSVKREVESVKQHYMKRIYDRTAADQALTNVGINATARRRFISEWDLEFSLPHREIESSEVIKLFREGLITLADLQGRLFNLGWNQADTATLVLQAQHDIALAVVKAQIVAAKTISQQRTAALKQAQLAQKQALAAQHHLAGLGTPAALKGWLVSGIISPAVFVRRLGLLGYGAGDIQFALDEANIARNEKIKAQIAKATKVPPPGKRTAAVATLAKWFKAGTINQATFVDKLTNLGYSPDEIADYVKSA